MNDKIKEELFLKSSDKVVMAADGRIFFTDEITVDELSAIARQVKLEDDWKKLRLERNARIAATDFMLLPDIELSDERRVALLTYRKALRDLPAQEGAPWDGGLSVPWPMLGF